jgi:hypothetical protein
MHTLLVKRADELMCIGGSPEEAELAAITDALEAYEEKRDKGSIANSIRIASPLRRGLIFR